MQPAIRNDSAAEPPGPGRGALTPARLLRGFGLFVLLTAVAFWFLSRRGTLGENVFENLRTIHPLALAIACLPAFLDQLLGGLRIRVCAHALGSRIGLWPCVLANCANVFLGGVTPSQHAGGPAQIWILVRNGMRFTTATVTSFCTYLGTVTFFLMLAVALPYVTDGATLGGAARVFTRAAALLFAGTLAVGALALPRPGSVNRAMHAVLVRIPRFGTRLATSAAVRGLERLFEDYSLLMRRAVRTGKLQLVAVVGLSTLIYLNKFFVAYIVVRGFDLHPPLREVLQLQAVQALVTYFVPTPGASGVAEVTAAELMDGIVPTATMGAFILVWRATSLYLGMALGAAALFATGFGRAARRASSAASTT